MCQFLLSRVLDIHGAVLACACSYPKTTSSANPPEFQPGLPAAHVSLHCDAGFERKPKRSLIYKAPASSNLVFFATLVGALFLRGKES